MADLNINLNGLELKNPVLTASGTFGYGLEFQDFIQLDKLGGFIVKGTTLKHREGNSYPRMAETPSGMLNAVGLQNKGVDYFIERIYPEIKDIETNILENVSGSTITDYAETAEKINALDHIPAIELNISCPNVKHGGVAFGTSCASVEEITVAVRKYCRKPLIVKLSPNVTDIAAIARACEAAGADGISLINTVLGMRLDLARRKPLLANTTGGMSGPAIFPLAVRMVYQVYEAVSIPIVGMGGVTCARDVIELMLAGATAVEVGAANLTDPFVCQTIIRELPQVMEQYHIESLEEIIGGAHHG